MSDDFGGFETESSKRNAKQGRRAQSKQAKAPPAPEFEGTPAGDSPQPTQDLDDGPPKPNRVSGWGEDAPRRRGRNLGEGMEQFEEDIFHGLDIESEMEKIERPRRPRKLEGWGTEQEELSDCDPE